MPEIVSRAGWGARAPKQRLLMARSKGMFTHYTAGGRARNREAGLSTTRSVQRFHMDSRGWSDIAYSFLVDDEGTIYEGRGWGVIGGHTSGHNSTSHAVCAHLNAGDHPTDAMLASIRWLHEEHDRRYGSGFHLPHRAVVNTSCPGTFLAGFMAQGMPVSGPAPAPAPAPAPDAPVDWAAVRRFLGAVCFNNLAVKGLPLIREGARLGVVKAIQESLNLIAGTKLSVDGHYGAPTADAVRNFQRFFGLPADGVFGPRTQMAMLAVLGKIRDGQA